jgi:hypothetical protein
LGHVRHQATAALKRALASRVLVTAADPGVGKMVPVSAIPLMIPAETVECGQSAPTGSTGRSHARLAVAVPSWGSFRGLDWDNPAKSGQELRFKTGHTPGMPVYGSWQPAGSAEKRPPKDGTAPGSWVDQRGNSNLAHGLSPYWADCPALALALSQVIGALSRHSPR